MKSLTIADLFCGAGGTSTGAVKAAEECGYNVKLTAVNHWNVAIATHTANHPEARHLCTSIDDINPRQLFSEGELDVLWASPECTHHSVARGGKPINEQSRATAWCVVRWAEAVQPKVILVENVPEFVTWGGLCADGRPLKAQKGKTFAAWVAALESLGYRVEWRVLCAADYGDPTTRRRLFVMAVRGKRKIVWPEPTHAPRAEGDLFGSRKRWVPARDIIDWTLPAGSIYERKKPLSEKTLNRIFEGLRKFGLKPSIIEACHGNDSATSDTRRARSVETPLGTVPCSNRFGVSEPFIMSAGGPECPARPVSEPVGTVLTRDHRALVEPYLVKLRGTNDAATVNQPTPTVTASGTHLGLAEPFIVRMHGNSDGESLDRPLSTVTAHTSKHCLAEPYLVQVNHEGETGRARSTDEPLPTVCGNRGEWALCEALLPQQSDGVLRSVDEPAPTVATAGAIGLVEPFLVEYYGTGGAASVEEPLGSVTTKHRHGLARPVVIIEGQRYVLDIRFRMLQPHELAAAQGFPADYQFSGNKTQKVKQIGNAVPCGLARAIVKAVLTQKSFE